MSDFEIVKRGYDPIEVDNYINKLVNDYESRLSEQKDRIFYLKDQIEKLSNTSDNELVTSLVSAVEKAKLIENSSKNIYELETKKLNLLYSKMENLLKDENAYNEKSIKQELLFLIQDCRKSLQNNISMQTQNIKETTLGDPVKKLLTKMIDFSKIHRERLLIKQEKAKEEVPPAVVKIIPTNDNLRREVPSSVKVVQIKRQEVKDKPQNVLTNVPNEFDKFLSENSNINGANFENIMFSNNNKFAEAYIKGANFGDYTPNATGFDLQEAVNPKEDLDEIMKAFDFFNDDKKKK